MQRSTAAAIAVFCILSAIAVISHFALPVRGFLPAKKMALAEADTAGQTVRILISRPDSPFFIHLEQKEGNWLLLLDGESRYPAQNRRVAQFLSELSIPRLVIPAPRSANDPHALQGAGTATVRLERENGSPLEIIEFGAADATGDHRYIRTGTGKAQILTAGAFDPWLDLRAASWTELSIFRDLLAESDIQTVAHVEGNTERRFVRGKDAEAENLQDVLESVRCLDITNIPLAPEETIILGMGNGKSLEFTLGALDADTAILSVGESGAAYIIGKNTVEAIRDSLGTR